MVELSDDEHGAPGYNNDPLLLVATCSVSYPCLERGTAIRIGSRPSKLALVQAKMIQQLLHDAIESNDSTISQIQSEIVPIDASGDNNIPIAASQDVPLAMKGVDFVGSLDAALADGKIDVAVHSLKDIPPDNRWKNDLVIGSYSDREDPLDVLVSDRYYALSSLPKNARVGSASVRRQAQLLSYRPDVEVVNVRGNVQARIAALERGDVDALILAAAGLERISKNEPIAMPYHQIPADDLLPGAGQGIVAAVCRTDDDEMVSLLKLIDNPSSRVAAVAERAFLDVIDTMQHDWPGRPPVAAHMSLDTCNQEWTFQGILLTPDGKRKIRVVHRLPRKCSSSDAFTLGTKAGHEVKEKAGNSFFADTK